jgi:hypothetical protein
MALDALAYPLNAVHWLALIASVLFMAYSEGYRGFQKGYSPRLARRLLHVRDHGNLIQCLLAPLYVMGYFGATRRRLIVTYLLTILIISFIVLFRHIPQPWRGVLDAGVVVGLIWGIIATLVAAGRYWFSPPSELLATTEESGN